jgi:ABC-type uncharacterized transport system auxiliary subunit
VNASRKLAALFSIVALAGGGAPGCALTQRGASIPWQYFTPEQAGTAQLTSASVDTNGSHPQVCLGRVSAGTSLGKRIAYRESEHQMGYYEDRRWTEEPARYVHRSLERMLFQQHAFQCDHDAKAATLDVEVLGFEELKMGTTHAARIDVRAVLRTRERVIFDEDVRAVDPVAGATFDDVVTSFGRALDRVSGDLARRVGAALAERSNDQ